MSQVCREAVLIYDVCVQSYPASKYDSLMPSKYRRMRQGVGGRTV